MGPVELDPTLASDVTASLIDGTPVDEVHAVMAGESAAVLGHSHLTEEDVRSLINPPDETESVQVLVRARRDGAPLQWWAAFRDPGVATVDAFVRSHPAVRGVLGDRLAAAGWEFLLRWVCDQPLSAGLEVPVQTIVLQGNEASRQQLAAAGFSYARTSWGMSGPVADAPTAASAPDGFAIVPADDATVVHRILEAGFVDHWGFEPRSFDDWWALERTRPGHDPTLWRLGLLDGSPVAALVMSRRAAGDGALYVQDLVTGEAHRGRGIASSLLAHAFVVAAEEGLASVDLHVDSSNTHHAPEIYRRAGLEVTYARETFARTLRC